MKMLRKLLVAASILMFVSVSAFANGAGEFDLMDMGEMTEEDFESYFGNTPANQIAIDLFGGECDLVEIDEEDITEDFYSLLEEVEEEVADEVSEYTVVGVADDEVLIVVHMGSGCFFAYYIE